MYFAHKNGDFYAVANIKSNKYLYSIYKAPKNTFWTTTTIKNNKSKYTGGHCERVPKIAELLLDAANENNDKFKDFKFDSKDQRREFHIAAWLHDCGKVKDKHMDKDLFIEKKIYKKYLKIN